jgi:hypothetical protein
MTVSLWGQRVGDPERLYWPANSGPQGTGGRPASQIKATEARSEKTPCPVGQISGLRLAFEKESKTMSEQIGSISELVEIAKRNGDFRKNYGMVLGAYLYLRSISAARGRSYFWVCVTLTVCSAVLTWLKSGRPGLHGL